MSIDNQGAKTHQGAAHSIETPPAALSPPAEHAAPPSPPNHAAAPLRRSGLVRWLVIGVVAVLVLGASLYFAWPALLLSLTTASTDDAYVNGHVTFVASRVPGQVARVLVDDNIRVRAGDLLVQLDREPNQIQVNLKKAAVEVAETQLAAAKAQVRGVLALARSQRYKMETAVQQVDDQVALLKAKVAILHSREATGARARSEVERGRALLLKQAMSQEEFDQRQEAVRVADALVEQATEDIYELRAALGLPPKPPEGNDLTQTPPDLDQTFSSVRTALAELLQSGAQLGLPLPSTNATPKQFMEEFRKRDALNATVIGASEVGFLDAPLGQGPLLAASALPPGRTDSGDIDRIVAAIIPEAPAVKQAEAALDQAHRDLDQAELNLRYCDVRAEIDGVVTRRNVNPGNNVQAGQQLMAVRSVQEIWIDANFKETQLAALRIGQAVDVYADTYGGKRLFRGRISGFTMGTGSTLALLPAQNATGNFVKVVQRLPVRIDLIDGNPEDAPLFVGLSVTPYVYTSGRCDGPDAGAKLQGYSPASRDSGQTGGTGK